VVSIFVTRWVTNRKYDVKKPNHVDAITPAPILKSLTPNTTPIVDDRSVVFPNHWKLEVNGSVKFDIKVEWSDGNVSTFSGKAPEIYEMDRKKGVTPINTAGIPPEWADDGISYQWNLNDHLWC